MSGESEKPGDTRRRFHDQLSRQVGKKETRKMRARRETHRTIWFGLGMFGLVGWSVAIPTIIGVALGIWLDATWPGPYSWTLMLLILGVALGCLNAWLWVSRERRQIETGEGEEGEGE
ncbi:MAG: AtpZ/AtpI family protein [Candidatus Brocadiia bacterium]